LSDCMQGMRNTDDSKDSSGAEQVRDAIRDTKWKDVNESVSITL